MDTFKTWGEAAIVRALKTFAQSAIALIGTGSVGFTDLDWLQILSISGVAALVSILTSIVGLPEVSNGDSVFSITSKTDNDDGTGNW